MPNLEPTTESFLVSSEFQNLNSTAQAFLIILCHISNTFSSGKCHQVTEKTEDWINASTENSSIVSVQTWNNSSTSLSDVWKSNFNESFYNITEPNFNSSLFITEDAKNNTDVTFDIFSTIAQNHGNNSYEECNVTYSNLIDSINYNYADVLFHIYGELPIEGLLRSHFKFENLSEYFGPVDFEIEGNCSEALGHVEKEQGDWKREMQKIHEFQIIKAVVLAAVIMVILASTCKMVFQLFVQYSDTSKAEK
ncbi:hypothetical protein QYM36_010210 [Artemia franciscana]|uniref:Transmembrane protein n=1 Tax=Artemia franciscana TaxID=6661 RepID=A0AA88I009_ARTSF|nr:hypothetical protein QYM36_010210 [Artemia franciscana]KAK2715547.1 hypothetical protein QYM36_010210 [Artemia franciscana]